MSAPADLLAAALDYAARGIPVFPCRADTKRPHTEHGFKEAGIDAQQIRAWWRRWPDAMVACPTGPKVDAWMLDIDDPVAFEAACTVTLPARRKSVTGKGYHLWFLWDAAAPMRNAQRSARGWPFPLLPGAEVRGEGGYVILPPSLHPNGRTYAWECDEPACEAPAELLALMLAASAPAAPEPLLAPCASAFAVRAGEDTGYGMAALRTECAAISIAPAGAQERALNDGALKIGGLVSGGRLSFSTVLAQLIAAGFSLTSHNPADPWTPARITAKVERALREGMRSPRQATGTLATASPQAIASGA